VRGITEEQVAEAGRSFGAANLVEEVISGAKTVSFA